MVGCSDTPGIVGGEPTLPDPAPRDLVIETLVDRVTTLAGETLSVTCVVSENREQVTDVATQVTVDGQPSAQTAEGVASVILVTRGSYLVSCEGIEEDVRDDIGVAIQVLPAAPILVETALSAEQLPAGAPLLVTCSLEDAFGNSIERLVELPAEDSLSWNGDSSLSVSRRMNLHFERVEPSPETICWHVQLVNLRR